VVIAVSAVASASEPSLPARTAAQLLTEVQQSAARRLQPLTATVQETASLGLPALPQIGGQSSPTSGLAGTTTLDIWYLNPQHFRLAEPTELGESDARLDGTKLWLWDSKTQTATHVLLPPMTSWGSHHVVDGGGGGPGGGSASFVPTPAAVTRQLLAAIGPSTSVRVEQNVTVAGRSAYQLAFAPKASGSLVSQIVVAIDASTHLPLRVQVFAAGSSGPAFQLGFTALTFGAPAASNFTFTPPPGAKVKTVKVPDSLKNGPLGGLGGLGGALGQLGVAGPVASPVIQGGFSSSSGGSASLGPAPQAKLSMTQLNLMERSFAASLPKSMSKAQRAAAMKAFAAGLRGQLIGRLPTAATGTGGFSAVNPLGGGGFMSANPLGGSPRVIGKDWLSVVATPPSPVVVAVVAQALAGPGKTASAPVVSRTGSPVGSAAYSSTLTITASGPAPAGPDLAVLRAVLQATTPVSGSWGHGRLLRTSLLSVLITSNGRLLFGAVTPAVLYADAASLSR
jgi:outer membrane lipoprotein-sorting protein